MKKILIFTDAWHPQVNGVVRTYEFLKIELEKSGHIVEVIGPTDCKSTISAPGYEEIKLAVVPYKLVKQAMEISQPDIIHIATEGPIGWAARRYCRKHKHHFTTCYHSQFPDYFALRLSKYAPFTFPLFYKIGIHVIKKFHNASNGVFVTTQSMTKELQKWGITAPIRPLTRGVDDAIFNINNKEKENGEGVFDKVKKPIALYVGRLAIEKNVEEFLKMTWDGTKVVVGHGPLQKELEKKYPEAVFVGKKTGKDLADIYRACDVFVFPSYTDTFGIVLIEALACGTPIAAHPVIGPIDVVTDERLGALDKDLSLAAKKALKSNNSPDFQNKHVKEHYSWKTAAEQFLAGSHKADEQLSSD